MGWWVDPGGVVGKKEEGVGIKVFSFTKTNDFWSKFTKKKFFLGRKYVCREKRPTCYCKYVLGLIQPHLMTWAQ